MEWEGLASSPTVTTDSRRATASVYPPAKRSQCSAPHGRCESPRQAPECPLNKRSWQWGELSWAVLRALLSTLESEPETEPPPLGLGVSMDKGHCSHCC